jgi:Kef-type K+ transport system membrane component KefB
MAHLDHRYLPLLLLLGCSIVGPLAAVRLRLPTAVVLILLGIGLGPAGIGVLQESPTVGFLSDFGFLVLMFMAGMEIDFDSIRSAGRSALWVPLLVVAGIFAIGFASMKWLGIGSIGVLSVAAMSVGMPLAMLKETGQDTAPLGRHVMLTASVGEFFCILGITALELVASGPFGLHSLIRILKVTALFLISAWVIRLLRAAVWWYPEPLLRLIGKHDVAELGVRVGLAIMLFFVVLSALAGVEAILGAFIGGTLLAIVLREKHSLETKLAALGNGLFIPIFFIVVGVRFDARALDLAGVRRAFFIALLAGIAKILPSRLFAKRGTPFRQRLGAGLLLSAPLTLVVAIAAIGRNMGLIDGPIQASLILVAVLVSVVYPTLFKLLVRSAETT